MPHHTIRVLVVDDEPRFRENLVTLLTLRGFAVNAAENGARALALLADHPFDVVVLDMRMPELDGGKTMRAMQALPAPPACIILTGHASFEEAVEGVRHGAADYLLKPCSTDELEERILRAFERLREQRGGGPGNAADL